MAQLSGTSPLLDAFWSLSAVDPQERIKAVNALISIVRGAQTEFESMVAKTGHLSPTPSERPSCNDVTYALSRLTRGVCSSNGAARQGYAVALSEFLSTLPCVKPLEAVHLLMKTTQVPKRGSRDEIREAMLGRVFGLAAIVRSGRVASLVGVTCDPCVLDPTLDVAEALRASSAAAAAAAAGGEGEDDEDMERGHATSSSSSTLPTPLLSTLLRHLLYVGVKKTWVADAAYETASALIEEAGVKAWTSELEEVTVEHLRGGPSTWSADQLSFALALEQLMLRWYPDNDMAWPAFMTQLRAALDRNAMAMYRAGVEDDSADQQAALEAGTATATNGKPRSGSLDSAASSGSGGGASSEGEESVGKSTPYLPIASHPFATALLACTHNYPQLHTVWGHLLQRYATTAFAPYSPPTREGADNAPSEAILSFTEVWRVCVDELLMPQGPERKATALALLASAIPQAARAHPAALAAILSPRLIQSIVRNASSKKRMLHSPAIYALELLRTSCTGRCDAASAAVVTLLARGHPDFDRKSHTNTVAHLLAQMDEESILRHIAAAQREFARPSAAAVYADIASTASGLTGVELASVATGEGEHDDDDDDEEVVKLDRRVLSPSETRRLWALDTITSSLRNPAFTIFQNVGVRDRVFGFLAYHIYVDAQIPEGVLEKLTSGSLDALVAATLTGGASEPSGGKAASGKKRSRSEALEKPVIAALARIHAVAGLVPTTTTSAAVASAPSSVKGADLVCLSADPPISDAMRVEVRQRMHAILRQVAAAPPPTAPGSEKVAAAAVGGDAGAAPLPPSKDKFVSSTAVALHLGATINAVWDVSSSVADSLAPADGGEASDDALQLRVSPSTEDMQVKLDEGEDGGSGEEEEEEEASSASGGTGPTLALVRQHALSMGSYLGELALTLQAEAVSLQAEAGKGAAGEVAEAARAAISFASLLTLAGVQLLDDVSGDVMGGHEAASALFDVVQTTASIVGVVFTDALAHIKSRATTASTGASTTAAAATPAKTRTPHKGASKEKAAPLTGPAARVVEVLSKALGKLPALALPQDSAESPSVDRDVEVFTDACLAILANCSIDLRDAVKHAARVAFAFITPNAVAAILDVVTTRSVVRGEAGEDEGASDSDSESEDESEEEAGKPAGKSKQVGGGKGKGKAAPMVVMSAPTDDDDDVDSDSVSSSGSEASSASEDAGGEKMESYDLMLGAMIRARKDKKAAAKETRQRELNFKFRALDLLEVAVNRLVATRTTGSGTGDAKGSREGSVGAVSSARILSLPLPMVEALKELSSRTKVTSQSPALVAAAGEAEKLLHRLQQLLTSVTRARLSVSDASSGGGTVGASSEDVLQLFDEVVQAVTDDPTPAFTEACGAIATMTLRLLRAPTASVKPGEGAVANAPPQPAVRYVDHLAAGYASIITIYFAEEHTRMSTSFFKSVFNQFPVVAVRLLPTFAALITTRAITHSFKLAEAFGFMQAILKAAGAAIMLPCPCAYLTKEDGTTSSETVSIREYLGGTSPALVAAVTTVLEACVADVDTAATATTTTATASPVVPEGGEDAAAATPATTTTDTAAAAGVRVKGGKKKKIVKVMGGKRKAGSGGMSPQHLREPLSLITLLSRHHLLRSGASAGAALDSLNRLAESGAYSTMSSVIGNAAKAMSAVAGVHTTSSHAAPPVATNGTSSSGEPKSAKKSKPSASGVGTPVAAAAPEVEVEAEVEVAAPKSAKKSKAALVATPAKATASEEAPVTASKGEPKSSKKAAAAASSTPAAAPVSTVKAAAGAGEASGRKAKKPRHEE